MRGQLPQGVVAHVEEGQSRQSVHGGGAQLGHAAPGHVQQIQGGQVAQEAEFRQQQTVVPCQPKGL